jgi:cytochrome c oxidase assembly protein subunit 11
MSGSQDDGRQRAARGVRRTVAACAGMVLAMGGLALASAPLYDMFCKATGFNGTPLVGAAPAAAPGEALAPVTVRFDTNVSKNLSWRFRPEQSSVEAVPGQTATVFFKVTNVGKEPAKGIAVFNVQPDLMGSYFVKVQCFCFDEHLLQPGESAEFPLVFYVDPAMRKDPDIGTLAEMTLSYTYFPSKNGAPVAEVAKPARTTNF